MKWSCLRPTDTSLTEAFASQCPARIHRIRDIHLYGLLVSEPYRRSFVYRQTRTPALSYHPRIYHKPPPHSDYFLLYPHIQASLTKLLPIKELYRRAVWALPTGALHKRGWLIVTGLKFGSAMRSAPPDFQAPTLLAPTPLPPPVWSGPVGRGGEGAPSY